jgi:hypothetical protein
MKLHFEPDLDYQLQAIEAVCDLFRGQEQCRTEFTVTMRLPDEAQMSLDVAQSDLVIEGNTYATRNVGSVRMVTVPAKRALGIAMAVIGAFFMFSTAPVFGLMLAVAGAIIAMVARARAKLLLMAGGGESVAIESTETKFVSQLHAAIVEAISAR